MKRILLIDDDPILTMLLSGILKKSGYEVITAHNGATGLKMAFGKHPDLIITDYKMPDYSGLDVLIEIKKGGLATPVILLTAHGDVSLTIKAIQHGAFDFIEKPINPKEILEAISNGLELAERNRSRSEMLKPAARKTLEENLLVGKDPAMREIFKNIGRVSLNKVNIVITGEIGTGKERVARLIHYSGISRDHPMVTVNCSSISEEELTRELFGTQDARTKTGVRSGKLEQAGLGTVFLSEVSRLPLNLQPRLLEIIKKVQEDEFGRSVIQRRFIGRIVASSSDDIEGMVREGKFLKDLYYQIKEFSIHVPPLRERKSDIPELVSHLLPQICRSLDKNIDTIRDDVIPYLQSYDWPGNVRELKNILTQAMILSYGGILQKKHIIIHGSGSVEPEVDKGTIVPLAEIEKEHIRKVLAATNWSKQESAELLGITRPTLNAKIDKYGLTP
jgi:two-component system, NtrC family, response regulator AtoC